MSRLDAVVRVLKATGKALHYDVITRQALHQGIIRFTGSQGTAGESMKVSCACMSVSVDVWAHIKGRAVHKFENTRHHMCVSKETDVQPKETKISCFIPGVYRKF